MKIRFCGAAGTVTGSCHLFEAAGKKILVDCGLFQGEPDVAARNHADFPFEPREIDAVVVTHAHIDHIGRLPRLVRKGFRGVIVATKATAELAGVSLLDSAEAARRDDRAPLYDTTDVSAVWERIAHKPAMGEQLALFDGVAVTLHPAGHIFGAVSPLFEVEEGGRTRRVLFSGDIGRNGTPIIRDPEPPELADVLVIESTYGDRDHKTMKDSGEELFLALEKAAADGGNVLVPAFALGRVQEVLYHLNDFAEAGLLEKFHVFLDSPLASRFLAVFRNNPDLFDEDAKMLLAGGDDPFRFERLHITAGSRESREIDDYKDGAIVVAPSGMCETGRIRHHLARLLPRPETDVIFLGFQGRGTLGRALVEGAKRVEIDGRSVEVRARIHTLGGFSAHAGKSELLAWARRATCPGAPCFVVHGESRPARSLAEALASDPGLQTHVPKHLETVGLG
ncbi:MAG: MBL fold metallo-hydrolase [Planctomycetes bacterium]|nr:MBL fold metallo-hydrolase [Planctomycetota bacterium]